MSVATLLPYRGRRILASIFVAALAMLLSVAVSVPPAMADTIQPGKPIPQQVRYNYGLSYYWATNYKNHPPDWRPTPLYLTPQDPALNPQAITPARPALPPPAGSEPLTGKLFLPGEPLPNGAPSGTVMKPPSVYKPTIPFLPDAGVLSTGLSKALGAAGFGMGGVSTSPANWKDIALSKGVAQGCIDNAATCSHADMSTVFGITNCSATASCTSIGAKDDSGNAITSEGDFFKTDVIPFLNDLWAKLTGQTDQNPINADVHHDVNTRGCNKALQWVPGTGNNGSFKVSITTDHGRPPPSQSVNVTYYDAACSSAGAGSYASTSPGMYSTSCIDNSTGQIATNTGNATQGPLTDFRTDGTNTNKYGMCGYGDPTKFTLFSVKVWNPWTQAQFDGSPSSWAAVGYSEWINPDPNVNKINQNSSTTTTTCATANGDQFTFSQTVTSTGGYAAPSCPPGSDLVAHNVTNNTVGDINGKRTIDAGAVDPAAASNYPLCDQRTGPGCSLSVWVDGTACRSTRTECSTWTNIEGTQPSRVECHWGTYVMPVSDCFSIAEGYKSQNPLILDPKSGVWTATDVYGKPIAPSAQPWNPTNPNPVVGASPGTTTPTATAPGGAGKPDPTMGDAGGQSCFPTGWSALNPIQWVYQPVQCALKWAFVPDTATMAGLQTNVQADIDHVGFKPVQTAVVGMFAPLASGGSGCQGPPITFAMDGQSQTIYPFNACTAPMSIAAGICNALFTLAFTVGGGLALLRAISQAFGYNFSFGRGAGGTDA